MMPEENKKLSSAEREERLHMVDDVLFSKLSKRVATVAHERKFCPEQCRRIKNIEMKHEQQNLVRIKVFLIDTDPSSRIFYVSLQQTKIYLQFR